jgi:hypothetical protein
MKNPKSLSGFEPTAVRGKWFEVNDLKHICVDDDDEIVDIVVEINK